MPLSKRVRVAALAGVAVVALLSALARPAEAQERPGWYGSLEGRYLMSDGDRTSQLNAIPLFAPIATSVPPGGDGGGGKVALGYRFASPWDVHFAASENQLGEVTDTTSVVFLYNRFVGFQQRSTASADYQLLDFDAGYNFVLGGTDLRLSGGLRYAHFNENYSDTFSYIYGPFGLPTFDYRRVKFSGLGPLIGARARVPLGASRFAVIGAAGGSVLFGDRTSQETNSTFGTVNLRNERGVYELEGELSLAYSFGGAWTGEIGYRVEQWWNVVDTRTSFFISPVLASGNHSDGNLLTHGPFLRVDLHF